MTEITNNYKGFEENSSEYVTLLGGDISCQGEEEPEDLGPISTKHLLVWAYQIAKGMEYLGSKKVHHFINHLTYIHQKIFDTTYKYFYS